LNLNGEPVPPLRSGRPVKDNRIAMTRRYLFLILLLGACRSAPPRAARQVAGESGEVRAATVIAFTLQAADSLTGDGAREKLREFDAYTDLVFPMLEEQGIAVRSTHSDSLVVVLENGPTRTIMLRGLDYPYGYVLVEPGFAETILTGVVTDEELLEEASYYFGLDDDSPEDEQRRQVVLR
jgi:hypothetical protein